MTMTKKEAIEYHINTMYDIDLIQLVDEIHSYSGDYDLYVFYHMNEFNEVHEGCTPMEIAEEIIYAYGDFNVVDDYFHYDYAGCLSSCNEATAADLIRTNCMDDLVNDFMNMRGIVNLSRIVIAFYGISSPPTMIHFLMTKVMKF